MPCIRAVDLEHDIRRTAVNVREQRALICLGVDELNALARKVVQAVDIVLFLLDDALRARLAHPEHGLEHHARAVLNKLTDGMQVGREVRARGEDPLVVLALGLVEQLLVPFAEHDERRIVVDEDLHRLALAVQNAAKRRVFCSEMVGGTAVLDTRLRRALHDLVDVDARRRHRQQTDRRQHGKASADVVRHDEGLVALIVRKLLERAALLVRGRKDALLRALAAVFLLAKLLEDTKRNGRFGRRTRFGDNIDAEVPVSDNLDQIVQIAGGNIVAGKVDLGRALRADLIVHLTVHEFDRRARAQIRAADTDHDKYVRRSADLFRRLLDARKFLPVVIFRQIQPAKKIIARALAAFECILRDLYERLCVMNFVILHIPPEAVHLQFHRHSCISP